MNLEKVAKYQIWANDLIREIIASLTEEEFTKENVKDLSIHIILAIEWNLEAVIHKKSVDWGEMYDEYYKLPKETLLKKWRETDERPEEHIKKLKSKYKNRKTLPKENFKIGD